MATKITKAVIDFTTFDTDDITEGSTNKWFSLADETKLDGIETGADVTDTDNVNAAGATMNADTDVSANGWVLDEDNMASDDPTKVPTQQSVKAYVDSNAGTANTIDSDTSVADLGSGDHALQVTQDNASTYLATARISVDFGSSNECVAAGEAIIVAGAITASGSTETESGASTCTGVWSIVSNDVRFTNNTNNSSAATTKGIMTLTKIS